MDKVVYNIIHMANMTESNKKVLLMKVLQSSASSNATLPQPQDKDVVAIFDTCLSLATVSSTHSSLANYAFGIWAERYKGIVRKYVTVEMVSGLLTHRTASPILVVAWLKDVLSHVPEDTMVSLLPVSEWLDIDALTVFFLLYVVSLLLTICIESQPCTIQDFTS